jgi:uncharacterized protein involved in outer membrane biogenesis
MRVVRWTLAVLAVAVIAAAGVLFTLDSNSLKGPLTAWASARLGRTLTVDGPLSLEPGRTIRLSAERLRLGNAAWGSRPEMLLARRIVIELDAWSLIDRPVLIHRIEVDDLDLLLERTTDGDDNWQSGTRESEETGWRGSLPVVVDRVRMPNARVQFIGPRLTRPLDVHFDVLEQQRGGDGVLNFSGAGRANETELDLTARAGPFDRLMAGRNFEVTLDGHFGELRIESRARVDSLANPVNTEVNVKLEGADADYLATRLGVRNLGIGPLALTGTIAPAADGRGVQGTLSGRLGGFDIKANGALSDPATMQKMTVQIDVSGPDLSLLGGLAGMDRLPPEAFRLRANVARSRENLAINQVDLDLTDSSLRLRGSVSRLSALAGTDLELRISGSDVARFRRLLDIDGVATGPFELTGRIRQSDQGAEVIQLKSRTTLGELSVAGPLGAHPDYYGSRLRFEAAGPDLERVGVAFNVANLPAAAFSARGEFEWTRAGVVFRDSTLQADADRLTLNGRVGRQPLGRDTDVKFRIAGPDVRKPARALGMQRVPAVPYDLQGRLRRERGASRLDDLRGNLAGASVRLAGRVADTLSGGGTDLDLQIEGPALEAFAGLTPGYTLPAGPFRAAGGLKWTPETVEFRDLRLAAAGAEGRVDADIHLPMSAAAGRFDITARGPDLSRLLPAAGRVRRLTTSFDLRARGQANRGRWRFDEMRLDTGAGRIALAGDLDWSPDFSATALHLDVQLPNLARTGALFGRDWPALPLMLMADFSGTPTAFRMTQLSGKLGESDFSGQMSLALEKKKPELDLEVRSDFLDVTALTRDGAVEPAKPAAPSARRVIPDTPVPVQLLERVDGKIDITAARARILDSAFRDLRLVARLRDGGLTVEPLELQGPSGGKFVVRGEVVPGPDGARAELSASGRQTVLSLWSDTAAQAATRPKADLDVQLAASGRTWRELAATLDGRVRLVGGAGDAPVTGLELLLGNLWRELISTVTRGADARTIKLRCLALVAGIAGGVATTAPALAVQTENVNVITRGMLDLRNETLEFYLKTTPRSRLGVSAGEIINPYVKLAGPINAPRLAVDPKGTLFTGATAVATGGLSIVARSVWDRLFRAEDPCAAALAEAERLAAKPREKRRFPWLSR